MKLNLTLLKNTMGVVAVLREKNLKNCGMKFMIKSQRWIFGYKFSKHPSKARKSPSGSARSPQRNTKQHKLKMKHLSLFYVRGLYPTQTRKQGFVNLFNAARTKSAFDFFHKMRAIVFNERRKDTIGIGRRRE